MWANFVNHVLLDTGTFRQAVARMLHVFHVTVTTMQTFVTPKLVNVSVNIIQQEKLVSYVLEATMEMLLEVRNTMFNFFIISKTFENVVLYFLFFFFI